MGVAINTAATAPINPAGADPILKIPEIWEGMIRKCREPQKFVKLPIKSCRITKEEARSITRLITYEEGMDFKGEIEEELKLMKPLKVDFYVPSTKQAVENIVSRGSGGEDDLYMTFTFEWHHPDVAEGSEEHRQLEQKYWNMASAVVPHTIDVTRQMVRDGEIGR